MKQFNLKEYLKNPIKAIVTRSGANVRILCTDRKNEKYPIVALVQDRTGNCEDTYHYTINGEWVKGEIHPSDLFFATEKREGWINLYKINSIVSPGPRAYDTKKEAESAAGNRSDYISTIKIKWEE